VLNPLPEIAQTVREVAPDTLILVDCVTSLAATKVEVDEWGLDFALTGSQKAMALPPGLAFGVASERAYRRSLDVNDRGVYFSFEALERAAVRGQTSNTPAVSLLFALDAQLESIEAEGVTERWRRHQAMAERTWSWVEETRDRLDLDLRVLAPAERRSPSITCVALPAQLDGVAITQRMRDMGYTIASGYGRLKGSSFRIGHMGDHTVAELEELLERLTGVLGERGQGGG
jgi:aspartate aminotransferase-like enzyme